MVARGQDGRCARGLNIVLRRGIFEDVGHRSTKRDTFLNSLEVETAVRLIRRQLPLP